MTSKSKWWIPKSLRDLIARLSKVVDQHIKKEGKVTDQACRIARGMTTVADPVVYQVYDMAHDTAEPYAHQYWPHEADPRNYP